MTFISSINNVYKTSKSNFKRLDYFGCTYGFKARSDDTFKTGFGAFLTLCFITLLTLIIYREVD